MIVSGKQDRYTTAEETMALFKAAKMPKDLWLVDGAGHVDLHYFAKEQYEKKIIAFFDRQFSRHKHLKP